MDEKKIPPFRLAVRPSFPSSPDLINAVAWPDNPPSLRDSRRAFDIWQILSENLKKDAHCIQKGKQRNQEKKKTGGKAPVDLLKEPKATQTEEDLYSSTYLSRFIHEHILLVQWDLVMDGVDDDRLMPQDDDYEDPRGNPNAQMKVNKDCNHEAWKYGDFFDDQDNLYGDLSEVTLHDPSDDSKLQFKFPYVAKAPPTLAVLKDWHQKIFGTPSPHTKKEDNWKVLAKYIQDSAQHPMMMIKRTNLEHWGIKRDEFVLDISCAKDGDPDLSPLDLWTYAIILSPYNPALWISRAYLYYQQGHLDLALGDAYRGMLLIDVVLDNGKASQQPGLFRLAHHAVQMHLSFAPEETKVHERLYRSPGAAGFLASLRRVNHSIMALALVSLQCKDYLSSVTDHLLKRMAVPVRSSDMFKECIKVFEAAYSDDLDRPEREWRERWKSLFYESFYGKVSGKDHPQLKANTQSINPVAVQKKLTADLLQKSQVILSDDASTPPLQVGPALTGDGLGVFTTKNLSSGTFIYIEEPSVRGQLESQIIGTKRGQRHETSNCQNCFRKLGGSRKIALTSCRCKIAHHWCDNINQGVDDAESERGGPEGSLPYSCLEIGRSLYHRHACGKDWTWLHDAMRPCYDIRYRKYLTHTNERHGTLLSLMLRDIFDITLIRQEETGEPIMPHEIDELVPLQPRLGEEHFKNHRFPFGWIANIVVPFDTLLALGVNIFTRHEFDTWTIQACLRKLTLNAVPHFLDSNREVALEPRLFNDRSVEDGMPDESRNKHFDTGMIPADADFSLFDEWKEHKTKEAYMKSDAAPAEERQEWLKKMGALEYRTANLKTRKFPTNPDNFMPHAPNIYLYPGFALFNHGCKDVANAEARYGDPDGQAPNRIFVRTSAEVRKGQEIILRYEDELPSQQPDETKAPKEISTELARRLFGRICGCPSGGCEARRDRDISDDGEDVFMADT